MPIATPEIYAQMLDTAKAKGFAFPAINVSSSQTLNAALQGFADAGSDGIIQVSTGGAEYLSGPAVKNMVTGSVAFAAYAAEVAKNYPDPRRAAHRPLPGGEARRLRPSADRHLRRAGGARRGAAVPVPHVGRLRRAARGEPRDRPGPAGQVRRGTRHPRGRDRRRRRRGGRRRGQRSTRSSTPPPQDALDTVEALGLGDKGRYLTALTFGNVHGVYKPGNVKLRPEILKTAQDAIIASTARPPASAPARCPSTWSSTAARARPREEIAAAVTYGVVKMNVDTDTQYAFTRPVADHMFGNYDGVLKVDGEVGNKKVYDPRAWGKAAEAGMAARVVEACKNLRATGHTLG